MSVSTDNITVIVTPQAQHVVTITPQSAYNTTITDALAIRNVLPPTRFVDNAGRAITASYALRAEVDAEVQPSASYAVSASNLNAPQAHIASGYYTGSFNLDVDSNITYSIALLNTSSYDSAFFDYVVKSGSNIRAGTVGATWTSQSSVVEYYDVSTADIGSTAAVDFGVDIFSGSARLFVLSSDDDWVIKTIIRAI